MPCSGNPHSVLAAASAARSPSVSSSTPSFCPNSAQVRVVDAATGKRTAFGLEGDVEIVSARERGRSGSSTGGLGAGGGQGESELQLQRRRIADRRKLLLRRLEEVRQGLLAG